MYDRPLCINPSKCALKAPLGPPENKCSCTPHVNNLLNQSEYEVGKEKTKKKCKQLKIVKEGKAKSNKYSSEFEFADDAISLNNESLDDRPPSRASIKSNTSLEKSTTENPYITVNGKEELPCVQEIKKIRISENISSKGYNKNRNVKTDKGDDKEQIDVNNCVNKHVNNTCNNSKNAKINRINKNFDGNYNRLSVKNIYSYCTLPKNMKKCMNRSNQKSFVQKNVMPPKRVTPDGTTIYYWCDLNKKHLNGKPKIKKKYQIGILCVKKKNK